LCKWRDVSRDGGFRMLERILGRLARGGLVDYQTLAGELGVSPGLLEVALRELEKFGYVAGIPMMAGGFCQSCPAVRGCRQACRLEPAAKPVSMWALTEKGRRHLSQAEPSSRA